MTEMRRKSQRDEDEGRSEEMIEKVDPLDQQRVFRKLFDSFEESLSGYICLVRLKNY